MSSIFYSFDLKLSTARIALSLILLALFTYGNHASITIQEIPLPAIRKPVALLGFGQRLVIVHGTKISIYSSQDLSLITCIGKRKGEFKILSSGEGLSLTIDKSGLAVNSLGKLSWFTLDGRFLRERRFSYQNYTPYLHGYLVRETVMERKRMIMVYRFHDTVTGHDSPFFFRTLPTFQTRAGGFIRDFFSAMVPVLQVGGDKIYVTGMDNDSIDVYNQSLKKIRIIAGQPYKRRKITRQDRQQIISSYRGHPWYRNVRHVVLPALEFPEYFPGFRNFLVNEDGIYVQTFIAEGQRTLFLQYDHHGGLVRELRIPACWPVLVTFYLYTFQDQIFYRLVGSEREGYRVQLIPVEEK